MSPDFPVLGRKGAANLNATIQTIPLQGKYAKGKFNHRESRSLPRTTGGKDKVPSLNSL